MNNNISSVFSLRQWFGFIVAPLLFFILLLMPPPAGLDISGWRTAAVAVLMAIYWMTEALPISVTALYPLIFFPVLGILDIQKAAAPYANPLIFLFMGGFIIALGMERWGLHKRLALNIIKLIGTKPKAIIAGFMISSATLSMWVSNTATTLMMLPIGLSVIELTNQNNKELTHSKDSKFFSLALLLGIAYASSIGGIGTLIGTPTNALMAGFLKEAYGFELGFAQWMLIGLPIIVIGLPVAFVTLVKIIYPIKMNKLSGGKELINSELGKLGKMTKPEKLVSLVFGMVAILWCTRPIFTNIIPGLTDAGIAIFGALLLFLIPVNIKKGEFVLTWQYAEKLPWGILLLFGGGLSLATAINQTGLASWIGDRLSGFNEWPLVLLIMIFTLLIIFLTELNSNTATAAAFLPIAASLAMAINKSPLQFVVPVTLAASCAFMLPVATPPNAIIFGSGRITVPEMAKVGIVLNIFFSILITILCYLLVGRVLIF